jgi:outer membrane protein
MKKIIFLSLLLFNVIFFAGAQSTTSTTTTPLSLQQAIDYAYAHQNSFLSAQLDEEISKAKVQEIIGIGLPQVSGKVDVKNFVEIPTSFIPAEFFGGTPGEFVPVQFGTPWQAEAGVSVSQLLFDPTYLVGVKASKSLRELAMNNTQRTKIETTVDVSKAYFNVLVNRERMQLIDAQLARIKKLRDDTKAMYDNGFVEKVDFDRISVNYNNIVSEQEKIAKVIQLGEYYLKYQLGMSIFATITLTDSLNEERIRNYVVPAEKPDVTQRVEYSLMRINKDLETLNLKRYKGQYIPSLYAYGTLSANAQRGEFDFLDTDQRWFPVGIIGGSLQWNLFDGLQREKKIKQANLSVKKADLSLQNIGNALALEAENGRTNLQNALATLNTQKKNIELANDVVRISKLKYDQGVGSNLEILNAETSMREALTNYYNSLFDALVAKVDLDKALGNIK